MTSACLDIIHQLIFCPGRSRNLAEAINNQLRTHIIMLAISYKNKLFLYLQWSIFWLFLFLVSLKFILIKSGIIQDLLSFTEHPYQAQSCPIKTFNMLIAPMIIVNSYLDLVQLRDSIIFFDHYLRICNWLLTNELILLINRQRIITTNEVY